MEKRENAYTLKNIRLYGQAIIDLKNRRVEGFEILSRLILDNGQMVMPDIFIPIFEIDNKLIEFDYHVIKASFEFINKHKDLLKDKRIHINLSTETLAQDDFYDFIKGQVCHVDPKNIVFEILENYGSQKIIRSVRKIRSLGYAFAIDDFGKGYSSFERMKSIGVSYIKIDKMFMDHMTEKVEDLLILKSMIAMIRSLDLHVIAEGIESQEQLEFLYSQKCFLIQGFLFSTPLALEALLDQMKSIKKEVEEKVISLTSDDILQKNFYNRGPVFVQKISKNMKLKPINMPLMTYLKYPYPIFKNLKVIDLIPKDQHHEFENFLKEVQGLEEEKAIVLTMLDHLGQKYEVFLVVKWQEQDLSYVLYLEFVDTLQKGDLALMGLSKSYTQAFEHAPVGMIILSDDFKVEKWNACAEKIFLYESSKMVDMPLIKTLFDSKNRIDFQKLLLQSSVSETQTKIIKSRRQDQAVIFTKWQISATREITDVKRKYVCMVEDVTQALKKDEKLKKISLALDNTTSMIAMTDRAGYVNYINPQFTEVTAYEIYDFHDKTYSEVFGLEDDFLSKAVLAGQAFEKTLTSKNGHTYVTSINVHAVEGNNEIKGYIVFQKDLSNEKALISENQSIKDVMVGESQRSIFSDLTPGFINEINNPLSAMKTDVDYLLDQWQALEDLEKEEVAHDLKSHVNLLIKVLKGLKTVVDEVADDGWIIFDLKDLLEEVLEVTKSAYYYHCELKFEWDQQENYLLQGNPGSLKKSFIHLILNASEAVKSRKNSQAQIKVSMKSHGDRLEVSIEDNGIGMTKDTLDKMYEPLYTTQKNERPGLGLSVVKRIIESEHNGEIICRSKFHEGTQFKVLLKVFQKKNKEEG